MLFHAFPDGHKGVSLHCSISSQQQRASCLCHLGVHPSLPIYVCGTLSPLIPVITLNTRMALRSQVTSLIQPNRQLLDFFLCALHCCPHLPLVFPNSTYRPSSPTLPQNRELLLYLQVTTSHSSHLWVSSWSTVFQSDLI